MRRLYINVIPGSQHCKPSQSRRLTSWIEQGQVETPPCYDQVEWGNPYCQGHQAPTTGTWSSSGYPTAYDNMLLLLDWQVKFNPQSKWQVKQVQALPINCMKQWTNFFFNLFAALSTSAKSVNPNLKCRWMFTVD